MPLTNKEQKKFEDMFNDCADNTGSKNFLQNISDLIFEMTGSVNLRMSFHGIIDSL